MVDFETATSLLRALGGEVKETTDFGLIVKLRTQQYLLKNDEVADYLERKASLHKTTETQIWYPGYYEHVVQFEATGPRRYRPDENTLSVAAPDGTTIEIARPSPLFCISLIDAD